MASTGFAQNPMAQKTALNEEMLWKMSLVQTPKASPDGQKIIYGVRTTDLSLNKSQTDLYLWDFVLQKSTRISATPSSEVDYQWSPDGEWLYFLYPVEGAMQLHRMRSDGTNRTSLSKISGGVDGFGLSPKGTHWFYLAKVRLEPTLQERYPELPLATGKLFDQLMHRHWDRWHDGTYSHVFVQSLQDGTPQGAALDILANQPYHSPLPPSGSSSEIAWSPDGQWLVYPCKKMSGNQAAVSTNSDLYAYHLSQGETINLSENNPGYDTDPVFSPDGKYLSWLSMARDGYEADLNRVALLDWTTRSLQYLNTEQDLSAFEMCWAPDSKTLYYSVYEKGATKIYAHALSVKTTQTTSKATRSLKNRPSSPDQN